MNFYDVFSLCEPDVPNFEPEPLILEYMRIRGVVWQYVKKFLSTEQQEKLAPHKPPKKKLNTLTETLLKKIIKEESSEEE